MSHAGNDFPVYCNSLLATLNARRIIRGDSTDDDMSMSLQGVTKKTTTQSVIGTTQRASISDEPSTFLKLSFASAHAEQHLDQDRHHARARAG